MKAWLAQYPKDLSYLEFKNDIYSLANDENIDIRHIDEEELSEFWSILKNSGFISMDNISMDERVIFELASKLEYVIPCQISNGLNVQKWASTDTRWIIA